MIDLERRRDDHSTCGWKLVNVGELGQSVLASPVHCKVIWKRWIGDRTHRRVCADSFRANTEDVALGREERC